MAGAAAVRGPAVTSMVTRFADPGPFIDSNQFFVALNVVDVPTDPSLWPCVQRLIRRGLPGKRVRGILAKNPLGGFR